MGVVVLVFGVAKRKEDRVMIMFEINLLRGLIHVKIVRHK